jgi:hypothetical protein
MLQDQANPLLKSQMTAESFLRRFEPEVFDLLLDPETALVADTQRANCLALELGLQINPEGIYPRIVWELVYTPA